MVLGETTTEGNEARALPAGRRERLVGWYRRRGRSVEKKKSMGLAWRWWRVAARSQSREGVDPGALVLDLKERARVKVGHDRGRQQRR